MRMTILTRVVLSLALTLIPLSIFAQDAPRVPASAPQDRDLVFEPASSRSAVSVPRGYALVIGVSRYEKLEESRQLTYPESDAQAMYRVLISQEGGAFPAENVHLLLGPKATLKNIRHELEEWLPSVAQPADRVVVFFAGHGFVKNATGYFAPWDVDPERLETTAYPMKQLGDVLGTRVKSNWKVLLTDACHSGKINAETTNKALAQQFNSLPSSFLTLTAATEDEQSYEDQRLSTGFGLFTYFLAQGWKGNADNDPCNGLITASELIDYVRSNVRRYARERLLSQTPTARGDYDPGLLLGVTSSCSERGSERPSMLGTAIVEVNMDGADLYVDDAFVGKLAKDKPLVLPGLASGIRVFKGVHPAYEPDIKKIMIAPDQEITVTLRFRYAREQKKSAVDVLQQGERLLFAKRSDFNPVNILPVARKQSEADLRRAATLFERALTEDPTYALAAYRLGEARHLSGDFDGAARAFEKALGINPSYVPARVQLAAVLLESGDADAAIRELTEASRLEPDNDHLCSMMARSYHDKGVWARVVEWSDRAIRLNPSNAQAHLWRADALRLLAADVKDSARRLQLYGDARESYGSFLRLTNFESSLLDRLAFHFIGAGVGSRRHADQEEAYRGLRTSGFLGLCITEDKVGNLLRARSYCQRAVREGAENPMTHFILGNVNRNLFNQAASCDYLKAAARSYKRMLGINATLAESANARNYLEQIGGIAPKLGC